MRIAFVGKGGSGKTTLAALLSRFLAERGASVLAIDADINQQLAITLGMDEASAEVIPHLGNEVDRIKDYLRGTNPRIRSTDVMVKTTPPGSGSRLLRLSEHNKIWEHFERTINGVRLLATGPFTEDDLGISCYHAKTGAVELILNHLVDGPGEYVVVDMTAGADSFASGLFTRFDLTALVVEPTRQSLRVFEQYRRYAEGYGIRLVVVANKAANTDDLSYIRDSVGDSLIAVIPVSDFIRRLERGEPQPFVRVEPAIREALATIKTELDLCEKDWQKFHQLTVHFHVKNAESWANAVVGEDLSEQVDPEFAFDSNIVDNKSSNEK